MRHLFTFLFLALGLQIAEAQEPYRSFLEEGKQWIIKREIPELVSTIVYKTDYPNACIYVGENPYFLREEGGKVFLSEENSDEETVLYDFNLQLGDKWREYFDEDKLIVVNLDTIEVNGIYRKRIGFIEERRIDYYKSEGLVLDTGNPRKWADCWVEGIGSWYSPMDYPGWCIIGAKVTLQQCYVNDEVVFTYDDFFKEGITSNISQLRNRDFSSDRISDLQGRRVVNPQRGGLYIRDGRKYVAK